MPSSCPTDREAGDASRETSGRHPPPRLPPPVSRCPISLHPGSRSTLPAAICSAPIRCSRRPRAILAMGGTAAQTLLNTKQSLGALRNQLHRFRGIPVIVTYHPAALLRNPNWKKPTWDDVRIARRLLD